MNSTGGSQVLLQDMFATTFAKNFILVMVWLSLSYINGSVVATFFRNQIFNEDPRYILFIHMVMNDAVLLTITVTMTVVNYIFYTISVSVCTVFVLVAVIPSHNTPFNLAGMAIERYIAVCDPLRHSQICTVRRTYIFIGFIWFFSFVPDITDLFVMSTDKASVQRARNTILLHGAQLLMCMLTYIYSSVETLLNIIFPGHIREIRYVNYLISFIVPRFLSPIIYGVRDQKFRKYLKRYFVIRWRKAKTRVENQEV